ncbi:putative T7SS-secreted protein [Streptomyces sp. SID13726]|uniref:putative T7SS-secreted protein n=1 Tax=Streptomyces sp. SID13726 TaxID=2706058 RepID=UPI0013BB3F8E|nr:ADP-ribosyltransferase [Streptomyces sp. SID13726]NEB01433.1 hypothetical protein [Streptomyces sp. SID13726]
MGDLQDLVDGVNQGIADGVNATANVVGGTLDAVGLKSVGEKVRDGAEYVTGFTGAVVSERELGESDEPGELIHGSPGDLDDTVRHLRGFATAFENTGQALRKLDPNHWTGTAAESFQESFTTHPKRWLSAADACTAAADALASYRDTVSWARERAAEAIEQWRTAEAKSSAARQEYDQRVWDYRTALSFGSPSGPDTAPPTDPGDFADPGTAGREGAQEILRHARRERDSAAEAATAKVTAAYGAAPAGPGTWARFEAGVSDGFAAGNMELEHFVGGFVKGGTGLIRMVRTVDPTNPYNLTHPAQYLRNVTITGMGLLTAANHPVRTAKSLAGSGWSSDPSEALGTLVFDLASDVVTGGAATGLGTTRRTMTAVAKESVETAAERSTREVVGSAAEGGGEATAKAASKGGPPPDSWMSFKPTDHVAEDTARGKWGVDAPAEASPAPETTARDTAPDWDTLPDADRHRSATAEISEGAVTFRSNVGATRYGAEHWNDYADNLPVDQREALQRYTGNEYQRVNGYLRDVDNGYYDTPEVRRQVEHLDKALAGNPVPEDVVVRRGTGLEHYLKELDISAPSDMVGKVVRDEAYMSTSLGDAVFGNKEAVLHLRVPEGTPGLWMEKVSRYGDAERELLLGRGNEFTITQAFKDAGGKWQIYGKIHR